MAQAIPPLLTNIPSSSPAAIFSPRLGTLLQEANDLRLILGRLNRSLSGLGPTSLIAALLWGEHVVQPHEKPAPLQHGLDLEQPVAIYIHNTLSAAVLILPLASPAQFKLWLESIPTPSRVKYIIHGVQVTVLGSNAPHPLACTIQGQKAACQIGSPAWGDSYLLDDYLRPKELRHRNIVGLRQAWQSLSPNPRIAAIVRPRQLMRAAAQAWGRSVMRTHRLRASSHRKQIARNIQLIEKQLLRVTRHVNGIAIGISTTEQQYAMQLVANLTPLGIRRFTGWAPMDICQLRIRRWLSTPALFKAFIHAEPNTISTLLQYFGLSLPPQALNGGLGLMTFGIDARSVTSSTRDWIHTFPTAIGAGLRGPTSADYVHTLLQRQLQAPSPAFGDASGRPPIVRRGDSEQLEINVLDDLFLAATGVLGGYAAKRRLSAQNLDLPISQRSFLYAAVDLAAIDAALTSSLGSENHHTQLQWAESLRRQLFPVFEAFRSIQLSGAFEDRGQRIRFGLNVKP